MADTGAIEIAIIIIIISGSMQHYQWKYRIRSAEVYMILSVYNTISGNTQYYIQCILLVLHSFG